MSDDLGYSFLAPADPKWPGPYALEVHLREVPTERHFDPEQVQLPVAEAGALAMVTVAHPWSGSDRFPICAGHILVRDRRMKAVEALSFGGEATVMTGTDATVCRVSSPVPILHLVPGPHMDAEGAVTWLATEVEAILARRRAFYAGDEPAFAERLAAADPIRLYVATLGAVRHRLRQRRSTHDERDRLLAGVVERNLQAALAAGLASEPLPAVEAIL